MIGQRRKNPLTVSLVQDMGPPDWAVLANDIKDNYLHYDAFVVLSGTDTMAYTASALSFMLENLGASEIETNLVFVPRDANRYNCGCPSSQASPWSSRDRRYP